MADCATHTNVPRYLCACNDRARYRVVGHSDCFTIRDDVNGDVAVFSIAERYTRTSVQYIADKMNQAYEQGIQNAPRPTAGA